MPWLCDGWKPSCGTQQSFYFKHFFPVRCYNSLIFFALVLFLLTVEKVAVSLLAVQCFGKIVKQACNNKISLNFFEGCEEKDGLLIYRLKNSVFLACIFWELWIMTVESYFQVCTIGNSLSDYRECPGNRGSEWHGSSTSGLRHYSNSRIIFAHSTGNARNILFTYPEESASCSSSNASSTCYSFWYSIWVRLETMHCFLILSGRCVVSLETFLFLIEE